VNSSCGCAIGLGRALGGQKFVRQVWLPPRELRGRGGVVRLKWKRFDMALAVLYFPPPTTAAEKKSIWEKTVDQLCFAKSFYLGSGTYFPAYGPATHIDHVLVPTGLLGRVAFCGPNEQAARKLHLTSDYKLRDHVPIEIRVDYELDAEMRSMPHEWWNTDEIAAALQEGSLARDRFLADVEGDVARQKRDQFEEDKTPYKRGETIVDILRDRGRAHFAQRGGVVDAVRLRELRIERLVLCRQRAEARTCSSWWNPHEHKQPGADDSHLVSVHLPPLELELFFEGDDGLVAGDVDVEAGTRSRSIPGQQRARTAEKQAPGRHSRSGSTAPPQAQEGTRGRGRRRFRGVSANTARGRGRGQVAAGREEGVAGTRQDGQDPEGDSERLAPQYAGHARCGQLLHRRLDRPSRRPDIRADGEPDERVRQAGQAGEGGHRIPAPARFAGLLAATLAKGPVAIGQTAHMALTEYMELVKITTPAQLSEHVRLCKQARCYNPGQKKIYLEVCRCPVQAEFLAAIVAAGFARKGGRAPPSHLERDSIDWLQRL